MPRRTLGPAPDALELGVGLYGSLSAAGSHRLARGTTPPPSVVVGLTTGTSCRANVMATTGDPSDIRSGGSLWLHATSGRGSGVRGAESELTSNIITLPLSRASTA